MQNDWCLLVGTLGVEEATAQRVFAEMVAAYEMPSRAYHNLTHIQQVLASARLVAGQAVDWTAVQLAIWFHDVVYVPGEADNEAQSASFARRVLQNWAVAERLISAVEQLVLATELNASSRFHPDASLIQDADIATLGWSSDAYQQYAQAIRQEFAHVPEEVYRHGRCQILTYFLQKERLYHTDYFFARLEAPARQNLQQELEMLRG